MSSQAHQEGIIILLAIVSIGSIILSIVMKDTVLLFTGVAVILLDVVLLLDYEHRKKGIKAQ